MPWGVIFSNPNVWLLSIQYMCLAYGWSFYINWLPTYLRDARGASFKMGALLAGLPLLLGGAGCLVSAFLVPRLTKRLHFNTQIPRAAPALTDYNRCVITRGIREFVARDWAAVRACKDAYWADRIARLGPLEAFRVSEELRLQARMQTPSWPDDASRSDDLRARQVRPTASPCRFNPPRLTC